MSLKPYRLLIVGAGLTASVTSALIKHNLPSVEVYIWEKSHRIGGRMNTTWSPDGEASVDLGAQYITKTSQYAEKHKKYFGDLIQTGVLKPFPGKIEGTSIDNESEHFVAPNGIIAVVKHFLNSSGAEIKLNTFCQEINLLYNKATSNTTWIATTKDGSSKDFHGIIMTIPVPEILQLAGTFQDYLKNYHSSLEQVQYSSRYALALYFPKDAQVNLPWTAKYVHGHPCIRFVCVDSVKRGIDSLTSGPTVLVHTSVPFGLEHLDEDIEEIEKIIYGHFLELFPSLPRPTSTRCVQWRHSQVYKSFPGQPGAVVVSCKPLLILAGDAFVHSNFSGCIESATTVFEKLQEHLRI